MSGLGTEAGTEVEARQVDCFLHRENQELYECGLNTAHNLTILIPCALQYTISIANQSCQYGTRGWN